MWLIQPMTGRDRLEFVHHMNRYLTCVMSDSGQKLNKNINSDCLLIRTGPGPASPFKLSIIVSYALACIYMFVRGMYLI